MKKKHIIAFLLLISFTVKAQNVPYEKLEEFSKEISRIQFVANGQTYNDGTTDYEISFPDENFQVSFHNQLATNVVYKKNRDIEVMELTEDIDLSKAIGITVEFKKNNLIINKLFFTNGYSIKTQIIENGKVLNTVDKNYLEFFGNIYGNNSKNAGGPQLFSSLFDICTNFQKEKGLITDNEIENQKRDWGNLSSEDYITKHPKSLKTMQAKHLIQIKEKAKLEIIENRIKERIKKGETEFMNYNPSNFKLGLSIEDTNYLYPTLKLKINKNEPNELVSSDGNVKFYLKNGKTYGYTDVISYKKRELDDNLKYTFELGNKNKSALETKFQFPPSIQESDFSQFYYNLYKYQVGYVKIKYSAIPTDEEFSEYRLHYEDGDKISYTWNKNRKTVRLDITFLFNLGFMTLQRYGHNITISVIDENLVE